MAAKHNMGAGLVRGIFTTMSNDSAHTLIGTAAMALIALGAGIEWGAGYAALAIGGLLLAAVIYARTR